MKKGLDRDILEIARTEFLEKGFKGVSMRHVARKAGVSLSNIYYYYPGKDALFLEVVGPVKSKLDLMFGEWQETDTLTVSLDAYTDEEYQRHSVMALTGLTIQHAQELKLLLFNAQGSLLENITAKYIDSATRSGLNYLHKLAECFPKLSIALSAHFVRTMCAHTFTILGELVCRELNAEETAHFVRDLVAFNTAGWKGILYRNVYDHTLPYAE